MKPIAQMDLPELAAIVSTHLRHAGIQAVLSGGACVTVYTRNAYPSFDLDFIENVSSPPRRLKSVMAELGFAPKNRYFVHPETPFFVEFPSGPLSAGEEPLTEIIQRRYETGTLTLISPTECIKDRLAAYYHWQDRQCLKQALMVAQEEPINLQEIERWSVNDGKGALFLSIQSLLQSASGP